MKTRSPRLLACLLLILVAGPMTAGTKTYHLEIGDPERRSVEYDLVIDGIIDTQTGDSLDPAGVASRLEGTRIVLMGESHTDIEFHNAQLRIIQELVEAGRAVSIGLEMYPKGEQVHLDRWVGGQYSEQGFLDLSRWYKNWGYHWNYYRDIFVYARVNGLPMIALNTPREVISAVRKKGFTDLTEEEAALVPTEVDFDSEEHRTLFRTIFEDADGGFHMQLSDEMLDSFFQAQCTWDATFARNSLAAIEATGDNPSAVLVVLVGSGHVIYDLGIQRQLAQWSDAAISSVIPVPIADSEGERIDSVRASYADFIWGLPQSTHSLYPSLGVSTRKWEETEMRYVIDVQEDSVAARAGFAVGDLLVSLNGVDLVDRETYNKVMSEMRWGDNAVFTVNRGGEDLNLKIEFRRVANEELGEESETSDEPPAMKGSHGAPEGMPPATMKAMEMSGEKSEGGSH